MSSWNIERRLELRAFFVEGVTRRRRCLANAEHSLWHTDLVTQHELILLRISSSQFNFWESVRNLESSLPLGSLHSGAFT